MAITLDGTTGITASGNITGNYILGNGSQLSGIITSVSSLSNGTSNVAVATSGGNVTVGVGGTPNVAIFTATGANVTGYVNATGNVTGSYILGNGSLLTGLSGSSISNGTSNVVVAASGNVTVGVGGSAGVLTVTNTGANVTGTLNATGNANVGNLGTGGNISASYFLGNGSQLTGIDATAIQNGTANVRTFLNGNVTVSAAGTANVLVVTSTGANIAGTLNTGTGNANVGNLGATTVVATTLTGTLSTAAQTNVTSVGTLTALTVSGAITVNSGAAATAIVNGATSGVGNIGSSTVLFNTVFAKATSAQYADLAEMYEADQIIEPGTVVCFGGSKEITVCGEDASRRVAGVVSTNPSYIMNAGLQGEHVVAVALQGRVPVRVTGVIAKGDMMVATGDGRARAEHNPAMGTVLGKALADFNGADGTIEVVVGRV